MIKCDKAMRRSKERCLTPFYTRWKCNGMCEGCICALHKRHDGAWEHTSFKAGHSHGKADIEYYIKIGGDDDEQQGEG